MLSIHWQLLYNFHGLSWPVIKLVHRRRKQGGEGGGRPPRFFSLTESFESRSRVKLK